MTTAPPPKAAEAMALRESDWLESAVLPSASPTSGVYEALHASWVDSYRAAVLWAAEFAVQQAQIGPKTGLDRIALRAFADQLREQAAEIQP